MNSDYTLLIVDDIEENTELLVRHVSKQNFKTVSTNKGSEALNILNTQEIDLVLLDINMPELDGITLLSNIREQQSLDDVAVIMVTANEEINTALDCLKKGACGYITKPYDTKLLNKQILHCLNVSE